MAEPSFVLPTPPFHREDPLVFFSQMDIYFLCRGVMNQLDKLSCVSSILPTDIITEIRDILLKPTLEKPYETPREQIIAQLTVSKHIQVTQLLEQEELRDSTPSQFMKRLPQMAESTVHKTIVCYIFLQRLPEKYKLALASLDESISIEAVADLVAELLTTQMPTTSNVNDPTISLIKELRDEQRRLLARVDQLGGWRGEIVRKEKAKPKSQQVSVAVQRTREKAYILETQEVWRQSKLLHPTMLL